MIQRPPSGHTIDLTDEQLAKIGLVAVLEAQSRDNIWVAIKSLQGLDGPAWVKRKNDKFFQLTAAALSVAEPLDKQLFDILTEVERLRGELGWLRNAILHGTWAENGDGQLVTREWKREENLDLSRVDEAIELGSQLSLAAKASISRIADLIEVGKLPEGSSSTLPAIQVRSSNNVPVHL